MTTVYEISLEMMRHVTDVLQGQATDGSKTYLKDSRNLTQASEYYNNGVLWLRSGAHANKMLRLDGHVSQKVTFDEPLSSAICTQQVETGTVVGTVTGSGNATVIVTAAAMPNSPKTVSVAVLNTDTASQVGGKIRTALNADADVKAFFDISGSGADVILTTKIARANDSTINISIDNGTCTGLTAAPTSANTTAGVVGPRYAITRGVYPIDQIYGAIQTALDETWVTGEDVSLTGDGETLEFSLPANVNNVRDIWFERPSENNRMGVLSHWDEDKVNGVLRFEEDYPPRDADILHVLYKKPHDEITSYDTMISQEINRQWLVLAAARELLYWGRGMYESKSQLMIDDRINKVMAMLKGKKARNGMPEIMLKPAGGVRGNY